MTKLNSCSPFAALALALALVAAAPAHALINRAWVSGHGPDAAGCGAPTSPCRSFQYVHDNIIAAGGEIDVLDPAGYGSVTITKSLSIVNDGVGTAGVQQSSSGQDAITINAGANDAIHLRGLNIDGLGFAYNGVNLVAGGSLDIVNCVVRHFNNAGIAIEPSTADKFSITDTLTSDNVDGIVVWPSVTVNGAIKGVIANNNLSVGIYFASSGTSGSVSVSVVDSEASGNGGVGFEAQGNTSGATIVLALRGVTASNNQAGVASLASGGANVQIALAHSLIVRNGFGTNNQYGGTIYSYGDNDINFNSTDVNGTLTPIAQK